MLEHCRTECFVFSTNVSSYVMCSPIDYSFQNLANPHFLHYLQGLIQWGYAAMLDGGVVDCSHKSLLTCVLISIGQVL